jgi:hypothetical protein
MDLKSLSQLGRIEKEVEVQGFKFKLHTLSATDQENAVLSIPKDVEDDTVRLLKLQRAVLVQATDAINGESVDKKDLEQVYSEIQPKILSRLFGEYAEMMKSQDDLIGELKKN